MPATPDALFSYLEELGIVHTTVHHQPLFTVSESQALRGSIPGGHTKNLFLKDKKGALYLIVALEDATIDLKSLHRLLGATGRFSFASPEQMMENLGVAPGSVTAFGVFNDTAGRVTVVLDADLLAHETVNAHPLVNSMTTSIKSRDLLTFLRATGHEPRIVALTAEPAHRSGKEA
jgi:Ala-tRNA(Pro) deacylase